MNPYLNVARAAVLIGVFAGGARAASVTTHEAKLRSGCAGDSGARATVAAGSPVTIRSMMSGESVPCYRVAVTVDGKTLEGYLDATAIGGLEEFERSRRQTEAAIGFDALRLAGALPAASAQPASSAVAPGAVAPGGVAPGATKGQTAAGGLAGQALSLTRASQPLKALALLEPELKKSRDPALYTIAGAAAWQADDTAKALEYWRVALDLRPNPDLQALYTRLQSETQNDHAGSQLIGMRVQLRYDSGAIAADSAREILKMLDQEYARISGELGCPAQERVIGVAQSPEAYFRSTGSPAWAGGHFDGRIHVPVDANQPSASLQRALAHEMVHACLTLLGRWPLWLQEGVAQRLSGDALSPAAKQKLAEARTGGRLPRLTDLGADWSRLDAESAQAAYWESLAAIDLFYENRGGLGLRNLLRNPEWLPEVTTDLDRRLHDK